VVGGAALQLTMARLNGSALAFDGWMEVLARQGWLASGFVLPLVIMALARQGARLADAEGLRAGRAMERARALRALHDTALQTLGLIAQRATAADEPPAERLRQVRGLALGQASELRAALQQDDTRVEGDLLGELQVLAQGFCQRGLRVELVTAELDAEPPAPVTQALVGAAREALTNTAKHAGVAHAVVRASSSARGVEIVVRDQGRGFDPTVVTDGFGLDHSIRQRMSEVGGGAEIWSAPGRGTRIRVWWRIP
jgi:signal transduction histidine kinase